MQSLFNWAYRCLFISLISCNSFGNDLFCLTQNIYHEARGETDGGKIAVGFVTLNRVLNPDFPSSICEVVHQDCQFSWRCDKSEPINYEEWESANKVALNILSGKYINPIPNSVYYYNPKRSRPAWGRKFCTKYTTIENHRFCSG